MLWCLIAEHTPPQITVLTDDDKNLLERWKTMQTKAKVAGIIKNEQPALSTHQNNLQNVAVADGVSSVNPIIVDYTENSVHSVVSVQSTSTVSQDNSCVSSVISNPMSIPDVPSSESSQSSLGCQAFDTSSQMMMNNIPTDSGHCGQVASNVNNHNISISTQLNQNPLAGLPGQFMVSPPNLVDAPSDALARIAHDQAKGTTARLFSLSSGEAGKSSEVKSGSSSGSRLDFAGVFSQMSNHISPTDLQSQSNLDPSSQTLLPSYNEAVQAKMVALLQNHSVPEISMNQHNLPDINKPSPASDVIDMVSYSPQPGPSNAGNLRVSTRRDVNSLIMTSNNPVLAEHHSTDDSLDSPALHCGWQDIGQLSKQMFKSHVDDLTLAQTPKGTGGGYGVGFDLTALVQETLMETKADR